MENEKKLLEEKLQKVNASIDEVIKITNKMANIVEIIDTKELRWLELSEKQLA